MSRSGLGPHDAFPRSSGLLGSILCATLLATIGSSDTALGAESILPSESPSVAMLPPLGDHWVWVPDRLLSHSLLFDGDSGDVLGMIDSTSWLTPQTPLVAEDRNEIYSVDVGYSRGHRGERTDFLTIYDLKTMGYKDEIVYPTRAATGNTAIGYSSRIGPRFVGVFNQFPATSVSILDVEKRSFVEEIGVSGCSGIYEIDESRFATLCGDGTVTVVELTDRGRKKRLVRSKKFFDTLEDPVFTSAGRIGTRWIFVSFAGRVHSIDFADETPEIAASWSLVAEASGPSAWRPSGLQVVAVHEKSERLFVVMHEGGPGSHKDGGPEIWSFDLKQRERIGRIEPPSLSATFLGGLLGIDEGTFSFKLLTWILPGDIIHSIAVSQDAEPRLFMRNAGIGAVGVVDPDADPQKGTVVGILAEAGLFGPTLRVP